MNKRIWPVLWIVIVLALPGRGIAGLVTVTDQAGRQVVLTDRPVRIVSLAPSLTEVVFAVDRGKYVKGATENSNYPPEAASLPRVGSYRNPDLEKIIALKPDLCLAVLDGTPPSLRDRLTALNIPVYVTDPRNLEQVMTTIQEIGTLINAREKADELAADMKHRIERVQKTVATASEKPRVFFQIGIIPIVSVGSGTFIDELIRMAGGQNLTEGPETYPRLSLEKVLGLSPDVIIITSMARAQTFETVKAGWMKWTQIPAARDGRIFVVDSDIVDRPTPRLVLGLETLARLVHPELY